MPRMCSWVSEVSFHCCQIKLVKIRFHLNVVETGAGGIQIELIETALYCSSVRWYFVPFTLSLDVSQKPIIHCPFLFRHVNVPHC